MSKDKKSVDPEKSAKASRAVASQPRKDSGQFSSKPVEGVNPPIVNSISIMQPEASAVIQPSEEVLTPVDIALAAYQNTNQIVPVEEIFEEREINSPYGGKRIIKVYQMPNYIDREIDKVNLLIDSCESDGNWDDVRYELDIWDVDHEDYDDHQALRWNLQYEAYKADKANGIEYDFQNEIDQSQESAEEKQSSSAFWSSDPATHKAMSYSRQSRIIDGLANNENISKEIALSLASNPALTSLSVKVHLANNLDWGDEFYLEHLRYLNRCISTAEVGFDASSEEKERELASNRLDLANRDLDSFKTRYEISNEDTEVLHTIKKAPNKTMIFGAVKNI